MMAADEDALACDIAETYGIYDMRALPAGRLAVLAVGLREDSRIKTKMSGLTVPVGDLMTAAIVDRLTWIAWANSVDGQRGVNKPAQLVSKLLRRDAEKERQTVAYESPEEFEAERKRLLREVECRDRQ